MKRESKIFLTFIDNSHIMNRHRTTSRGIEINPEDNIMQAHGNGKKTRNDDGETDTASENDDDDHNRNHDTDTINLSQNGQRHSFVMKYQENRRFGIINRLPV